MRRTMARKANTIGKFEAENCNAAALRDSRPHMTSEKAPCDYSRSATDSVQESHGGSVGGVDGRSAVSVMMVVCHHCKYMRNAM